MIYLVLFEVFEPVMVIVRATNEQECKKIIDESWFVTEYKWSYRIITENEKEKGIILEWEY